MEKEFNLSEKRQALEEIDGEYFYLEEDVKEFISLIQKKVLLNWKGQNEFIDWLKKRVGEKLT